VLVAGSPGVDLPTVEAVCFSPEADLLAGVVVTAVGVDALRHMRHHREAVLAGLPVLFGIHQLIEVPVWWGFDGRVSADLAGGAAWLYLAIAFGIIPWIVPHAVHRIEDDQRRREWMGRLTGLGVAVAVALTLPIFIQPLSVSDAGNHIVYSPHLVLGGPLTGLYVVVTCGALVLSSDRVVAGYGWLNLVAVSALATLLITGVVSLWCVWAAVTSIAIALHLRLVHRRHEALAVAPIPA
jgi:hypothetical protein